MHFFASFIYKSYNKIMKMVNIEHCILNTFIYKCTLLSINNRGKLTYKKVSGRGKRV